MLIKKAATGNSLLPECRNYISTGGFSWQRTRADERKEKSCLPPSRCSRHSLLLQPPTARGSREAHKKLPRRRRGYARRGPRVRRQQRGPPKLNFSPPPEPLLPVAHRPPIHQAACHKAKPCQARVRCNRSLRKSAPETRCSFRR